MFRCSGRAGKGTRCEMSRDLVRAEQMGDFEPYHPSFAGNGRKSTVVHEPCGADTHYRLCPHCHSQLPVLFGQTESRLIALVGARNSGKTTYMTVLLHELLHDVGGRLNAAVLGADEHTRSTFEQDYEKRLYRNGELAGATRTAAAQLRRPLVFGMTVGSGNGRRIRRTILSFFDTAGEDLSSQSTVDQNVRYLASADGIILLLDPLQLPGARALVDPGAVLPKENAAADSPYNVLSRIIDLLQSGAGRPGKLDKPIAVAFSKMDALQGSLPDNSPLRRRPPTEPGLDEADSLEVHRHIRALLHDWSGHNLDDSLSSNFARYRLFGLSGLGDSPRIGDDGESQQVDGVPRPWRVEDPLLWLLGEFQVVPKIGKPDSGR